jgi:hypothetical protein
MKCFGTRDSRPRLKLRVLESIQDRIKSGHHRCNLPWGRIDLHIEPWLKLRPPRSSCGLITTPDVTESVQEAFCLLDTCA